MSTYWAVIGDVVRSRAIADRAAFQVRLEAVLAEANRRHADALASEWTVTLGDEFQALFPAGDLIPLALEEICHGLVGQALRFGVGHGALATPLKPQAVGMDGPCFHRARSAVEAARRARVAIVVETAAGTAESLSHIWTLVLAVIADRTPRQAEAVGAYRAAGSQAAAAKGLGVTQATVSSELARAHFGEVDAVISKLPLLLEESLGAARAGPGPQAAAPGGACRGDAP